MSQNTAQTQTAHTHTARTHTAPNRTLGRRTRATAALGIALLALTACASDGADTTTPAAEADAVTVEDAWVKAAGAGEMTAGFAVLENAADAEATVVSVSSAASPMIELHETVANAAGEMEMREVEGGFAIPAEGRLTLEPGGDHLMLMDLPEALAAGEDVAFTLAFADGSTLDVTAIVKDYAGANENYGTDEHGTDEHGEQ